MSVLVGLALAVPLVTAVACIMTRAWPAVQRAVSVGGAVALLGVAGALLVRVLKDGFLVVQAGGWPAPAGITLVADVLSALMILLSAVLAVACVTTATVTVDATREKHGFHALLHVLVMSSNGVFLTGDLFNLYVWVELNILASFALLALGGSVRELEGGFKAVLMNLVMSALLLVAVGLVYALTGTLNLADLAVKLPDARPPSVAVAATALLLAGFAVKAAAFPLFFWLTASYHTPPVAVSAFFAGVLTKVGVYALVRLVTLLPPWSDGFGQGVLAGVAATTMLAGVLGAFVQKDLRRVFAFHTVSQEGYMLMGLALLTPLGFAGAVFFMVHHGIVKAGLFLVSGLAHHARGTFVVKRLAGVGRERPFIAVLFVVLAASLAGFPPFSGFWAKHALLEADVASGLPVLTLVALATALLTLVSMLKVWSEGFLPLPRADAEPPRHAQPSAAPRARGFVLVAPPLALALLALVLGLAPEPVLETAKAASEQLADPDAYVQAVLGVPP